MVFGRGGGRITQTGFVLTVTGILATAVLPVSGTLAESALDERIADLKAAYNQGVRQMGSRALPIDTAIYKNITVNAIASTFDLGEVSVTTARPLFEHPGMGEAYAVRGRLIVSDAEEASPKAAPRTFRLYTKGEGAKDVVLTLIPMDVSHLPDRQRKFIDRHCGNAFACDATVYGRIGEVEAERQVNLFSFTGAMTTKIGLVGDYIRFHELRP